MTRIFTTCLTAFCWLALLPSCDRTPLDVATTAEFEEYLQEEMEFQHIPALAVLLFEGETVLYESYLGHANLDQNLALADNHLFLLASVSKVVTATALLQLHEDGAFALDDPIGPHLPFAVVHPDYTTPITFRMLLTHTSGIADGAALDDHYYYGEDPTVALGDFLESYLVPGGTAYDARDNFHDAEPGTEHQYSNTGNALIGLLVEEISGVDFNTYCKNEIFAPLNLNHTAWRLDEITETIVTPYHYRNRQYEAIAHYTFTDYPNGGLRSTAQDLHRFVQAFVRGGQSNGYTLLEPATVTEMLTPQIPEVDEEVGLHLFLMNAELGLWGHDGGEQGVATLMAFHPSTQRGVILLSNQGDANLDEMLAVAYRLAVKL